MNKFFSSKYFPLVFIPIAFLFTLIYSWATSPLYLSDGVDSSIFKTIGLGMTQGKMPYTDLFDHKGGLLFMIQSWGWLIAPGRWGLFLLQVIFSSASLFFLFKAAELFIDRKRAFFATLMSLLLYAVFMESGNQCEGYMLPFMSMTLYFALKYLSRNTTRHPLSYSLIYGISFAFMFWIRPNDAVSQVGSVMAGIFLYLIANKEYKNAIYNALTFLLGCTIVSIPIMAYFAYHNCLYPLIDGTLLYNMRYVSDNGQISIPMILVPTLIFGFLIWTSIKYEGKKYLWIFIPMLILTLVLIGKRAYMHYLIIIVPAATIMTAMIYRRNWRILIYCLLIAFALFSEKQHKYVFASFKAYDQQANFFKQPQRIIDNVPKEERNDIWNLNLMMASVDGLKNFSTMPAFLHSGITPCNRVFVDFHLETFGEEETVEANMPKWILADPTLETFEKYKVFLAEKYQIVDQTDNTCGGDVTLYRLKDEYWKTEGTIE